MGKFLSWFFGGAILYGLSTGGFGLFVIVTFAMSIAGTAIGENHTLVMAYTIGGMAIGYVLPVIVALHHKNIAWLIGVPLIASVVLAFPSSFVGFGACEAGDMSGAWAVRTIPLYWAAESAMATPKDDLDAMCVDTWLKS